MWSLAATVGLVTGGSDGHLPRLQRDGHSLVHESGSVRAVLPPLERTAVADVPFLRALAAQEAVPAPGRTPAAPAGELGVGAGQVAAGTSGPTSSVGLGGAGWRDDLPEITALIRAVFGEHGDEALRVFTCESGLRADAVSFDGSSFGIAQLHAATWAPVFPDFWQRWSDAQWNIEHAKVIFERAGSFSPWECW